MGRLLVLSLLAIILVVLVGAFIYAMYKAVVHQADKAAGRAVQGDLNARQERQIIDENEQAARIIAGLLAPATNIDDDIAVIPAHWRRAMESWQRKHNERKVSR